MALSIKNDEVERLARTLAARRNISITEAIRQSLAREVDESGMAKSARSPRLKAMMEVAEKAARIPRVNTKTDDEILGYDEYGAPTR
jgi:antitoxin VapB